jgi:DHA2 family multidrug resistance protein
MTATSEVLAGAQMPERAFPPALVAGVIAVNLLATFNVGVISVDMVTIGKALGANDLQDLWLCGIFTVALVCGTPAAPMLAAWIGPRRLLTWCTAGIGFASVAAALMPHFYTLLALIFVQGLAAAPIAPVTQALMASHAPPERRGTAMALWGVGGSIGFFLAPLLGGTIASVLHWQIAFLPAGAIAAVTLTLLPRALPADVGPIRPTDRMGLVLLPIAMLAGGTAIQMGPDFDWLDSVWVVSASAVAVAALAGFAWSRRGVSLPVISFAPLAMGSCALAVAVVALLNAVNTNAFCTVMLGDVSGYPAEWLGLRGSLGGIAIIVGQLLAGRMNDRMGSRAVLATGFTLLMAGKVGYLLYGVATPLPAAIWPFFVNDTGFGFIIVALAALNFRGVPQALNASAAGLFVQAGFVGQMAGYAIFEETLEALQGGTRTPYPAPPGPFHELLAIELVAGLLVALLCLAFRRTAQPATA